MDAEPRITTEVRGHVLLIGLDRPGKANAADLAMLRELSAAYGRLQRDPEVRVGLVHATGEHFTAGLDLADVAPRFASGDLDVVPEGGIDPWQLRGRDLTKPVVVAVHGTCLTLGVELILAADVAVAGASTRFGQIEVARGILPFGGATIRFPRHAGWGNAMRWMLTGELFDAAEAHRMGLVQEVVPDEAVFDRAFELARSIAAQAPLAVQATVRNARTAARSGQEAAAAVLREELAALATSEDAAEAMNAFLAKRPARFSGR